MDGGVEQSGCSGEWLLGEVGLELWTEELNASLVCRRRPEVCHSSQGQGVCDQAKKSCVGTRVLAANSWLPNPRL